jgi:type IX secretion system PorP/SprF family membrane protein
MKSVLFVISLLALMNKISAQQIGHLTQYFDNYLYTNPSYAGSTNMLGVSGFHREQWLGLKGAPSTTIVNIQSPLKYETVGVGASLLKDQIGPTNNTHVQLCFSYKLKFNETKSLYFGLNGGLSLFNSTTSNLISINENDPGKLSNQQNRALPNMGFGFLYRTPKLLIGFSSPKIIQNSLDGSENNVEKRHYFVQLGYLTKLNSQWSLRPTAQFIFVNGAPMNLDLTTSAIYKEKFIVGMNYRLQSAFGFIIQYQLNQNFRVGMASDFSLQKIRSYNNGTYEVGLTYDLALKNQKGLLFRYF